MVMRERRVLGASPKIAAAPPFPSMVQDVSSSTFVIWSRSTSIRFFRLLWDRCVEVGANTLSATSTIGPSDRIVAPSITFCNSRIFPGHWKWDQRAVSDLGHTMIACGDPVHRFLLILENVEQFLPNGKILKLFNRPSQKIVNPFVGQSLTPLSSRLSQ